MDNERVVESRRASWTCADDYLIALARRRHARRVRHIRGEPDSPRFALSTLPFALLIAMLAVLGVAIMVAAFPGLQPQHATAGPVTHEQGVAAKGWFQEAERDFHR